MKRLILMMKSTNLLKYKFILYCKFMYNDVLYIYKYWYTW